MAELYCNPCFMYLEVCKVRYFEKAKALEHVFKWRALGPCKK